jgi:beta-galactosidase/beta-glucuronidase
MIELIAVRQRDETRQVVYFTVDEYDFSAGNVPIELDTDAKVLAWLKKNEDSYMFLILQKMYRKGEMWADWGRFKTEENTNLSAMEEWISKGHKNKIITGYKDEAQKKPIYEYVVIEKLPFRSAHPAYLKKLKKIDSATNIDSKMKTLLKDIVKG